MMPVLLAARHRAAVRVHAVLETGLNEVAELLGGVFVLDRAAQPVWLYEHADQLDIDSGRIVVAGVSAGGGLAAAVALLARDRDGPPLAGQMLLCPMLNDRNDTRFAVQMDGIGVWDRTSNEIG
ncbi:alpha/beta hydrolase fold domain-containing protein [Rhodococcus sp. G-MC3]|uniref:alpha/beta hydrolase fold domain-containing protein n=1 Tax=Rhodococcus sp. G-MC3 TaxID=3046209 RepID=UPI0024B94C54|nr:alpha/beta hydrolase fold domain-containing protein [Rhodococcus sp. G-MC3]MDJ0396582.1 alpha/beta hydrolase fold domain-containing protein [Rhodococcus sp. G-MC3]